MNTTPTWRKRMAQGLCFGLPLVIWCLPISWFPLQGMTWVEQRLIGIFVFAALCWILEPIPIVATSIGVLVLELLMLSDRGILWLRQGDASSLGPLISYQALMGTMASPILLLFLGGFFLAMAATKYRLDFNLARVMLRPFGLRARFILLGFMLITGFFSMFMSNTATTAMMLSILVPVLACFREDEAARTAFALSIPIAANIGGLGTPIGSPPNAVALKYLTGAHTIHFAQWMAFGVPYVALLLLFAWLLLCFLFPFRSEEVQLDLEGQFLQTSKAWIVYATFVGTLLLWLTESWHGMNAYVVSMIPVALFLATEVITKEDLKKMGWDVLWLVAGGLALGLALEQTGLAKRIVHAIPFDAFWPVSIVLLMSLLAVSMASFMSNTATANLLLPVCVALATSLPGVQQLGGVRMLVLCVTFSCSLGMALPVSTPPNALAHATGQVQTKDMVKVGLLVGGFGLVNLFGMIAFLRWIGFFATT